MSNDDGIEGGASAIYQPLLLRSISAGLLPCAFYRCFMMALMSHSRRDSFIHRTDKNKSFFNSLAFVGRIVLKEWMMRNGGKSKDPTSSFAQSFANTADIEVQNRLQL